MTAHRAEQPGDFGVAWTLHTRDNGPSIDGSFGHHGARGSAIWIDPIATAVVLGRAGSVVSLKAQTASPKRRASGSHEAMRDLFHSLSAEQRKAVCFDWDCRVDKLGWKFVGQ